MFANWPRAWQAHAASLGKQEQGGMMKKVRSQYAYLSHEIFGKLKLGSPRIVEYPETGYAESLFLGRWESSVCPVSVNARVGGFHQDIVP